MPIVRARGSSEYAVHTSLNDDNIFRAFGEIRQGTNMYGIFAKKSLPPYTVVSTWGDTAIQIKNPFTQRPANMKLVKKYASFHNFSNRLYIMGPRFFECNGTAVHTPESRMAFSNEPSPDVMTRYDDRRKEIHRTPGVGVNNVCLVIFEEDTFPVFVTTRWIRVGDELTWCYGQYYKRDYPIGKCDCSTGEEHFPQSVENAPKIQPMQFHPFVFSTPCRR